MKSNTLVINYGGLPPSTNKYLIPSVTVRNGKPYPSFYESKESKAFKRHFGGYLKELVRNTGWDVKATKEGHWYLDCVFVQSRTNQDSNNFFKVLLDSMTGIVFNDDSNILVRVQKVAYNPDNPRFSLVLHKAKYVGKFTNEDDYKSFESGCESCSRYRKGSCSILKLIRENREVSEIQKEGNDIVCKEYKQRKK